ncbi:hypothetical protein BGZ60DRAFT_77361 [Tricladium varicosporioides]|nr:hypothetical protein BGZ60DRAFT_77361 [Hymenoscyphus varicosporioides]
MSSPYYYRMLCAPVSSFRILIALRDMGVNHNLTFSYPVPFCMVVFLVSFHIDWYTPIYRLTVSVLSRYNSAF